MNNEKREALDVFISCDFNGKSRTCIKPQNEKGWAANLMVMLLIPILHCLLETHVDNYVHMRICMYLFQRIDVYLGICCFCSCQIFMVR